VSSTRPRPGASDPPLRSGLPRSVDLIAGAIGLLLAGPLLGLAAAAVMLESRGGALFRQVRVGQHGRPFTLYKLRTMRIGSEGPQITSRADGRITRVGRLLRTLKIDELPTLWNVIKGDMSLVGPRPEVPRYVNLREPAWRSALRVRPGVTDPVTLRLRNEEDLLGAVPGDPDRWYRAYLLPHKLARYEEYLERRTIRSDLGVIVATLLAIVMPRREPAPTPEDIVRAVTGEPSADSTSDD